MLNYVYGIYSEAIYSSHAQLAYVRLLAALFSNAAKDNATKIVASKPFILIELTSQHSYSQGRPIKEL